MGTTSGPRSRQRRRPSSAVVGRCCGGWSGTACDVCETLAACPSRRDPKTGTTVDAYNCTAGLVEPTAEELDVGKRFSCVPCGSGIENAYCGYTDLPGASFDVVAFAERAEVAWRLGTFRDDNVHFPKQNFYDYAAYFEGNLTGCSYANDVCAWDDTKKCLTLTCGATAIDCPPAGLDECPGWTYDPCKHHYVCENECVKKSVFGCCKPKDGDDDDVMHGHRYHVNNPLCCAAGTEDGCQPTEIFWNGPATTFSCELDASEPLMPATARRCYLNQKHTGVDGFPLTCHVGNCLYNVAAQQHAASIVGGDVHFREPRPQRGVVPQLVALGAAVLALAAGAAAAYATSPLRRRAPLRRGLGAAAEAAANPLFAAEDGDDEAGAPLGGLGGGLDVAWADLTLEGRVSGSVSLGGAALCAAERRATLAFVPQDDGAARDADGRGAPPLPRGAAPRRPRRRRGARRARRRGPRRPRARDVRGSGSARAATRTTTPRAASGVSGGEARRVSVAAELLGTPAALLLDEPTSRLDSRAALRARSLRRVARGGADAAPVAVLATMHQPRPEIFLSLDGLCVVCKGAVAWRGSVARARRVAAALEPGGCENPGDVLLDAIAARGAGALAGLDDDGGGDEAPERRTPAAPGGAAAAPSPAAAAPRLAILLDRQLLRVFRAPSLLCLHAGGALAAAVCLGSIDSDLPKDLGGAQRRIGAIFFALFFLQLLALSALSTFREDAAVADAERVAVGGLYGPLPHLVSVLGSDLVLLRVLPALLLALVVYPYCNLRPRCAGALFAALFGGVAVGVDSDTTAHHGAAIETGGGGVVAALSQSLVRGAATPLFTRSARPSSASSPAPRTRVEIPAVDDPELQLSDSPPRGGPCRATSAAGAQRRLLTDDDARSDGEPAPPPPLRRVDDAGGEALRTKRPAIAWALPALVGGVVFANHYARDTPSALQEALEARWPMSSLQFGLLHNVYYVPNVFMPLVAGAMAQAAADATAPLVFFTGCACAGHALWAAGVGARSFPLLLGARCVLGACYEAIDLGSIPFMGPIFRDDWAKVVGVTNALLRVGSVATFGLSPALLAAFGLDAPLYAAGAVGAASGAGGAAGDVLVVRPRRRAGLRGRRDLARARVEDPRGRFGLSVAAADGLILCPEAAIVVLGPAVGFLVDKKRSALTARLVAAAVSALSFPWPLARAHGDGSAASHGTLVLSAGWSVFNTLFWATITVVSPPEALPWRRASSGPCSTSARGAARCWPSRGRAPRASCVSAAGAACLAVAAACVPPPEAPLPPPEDDDDALFGEAPPPRCRRLSSAFAPQDDVLPPHLTCREHLTFHAKLRLPGAWPAARKRRVARAEADALALDARCYEETRLGKASGGQRRRDVSRLGVTVVAVLHQPRREIFVALDRVALLVRGRLRVCGTPADVRAALDARAADGPMASNPADAMLDLAQAPGGLAVAASDAADAPSPQSAPAPRPAPVGGFQALCLLATRERRQCLRDGPLLVLQYVPALVAFAPPRAPLPLRVAPPLALAGLVVGLSHAAKTYNHALGFVLAAFQIHYVLAATGRAVGAVASSNAIASAATSLLLLFNLLLSGFFINPADLAPVWRALASCLPMSYAYEALVAHEFALVEDLYISSKR
ncbi:ATPase [Aureococcus anophagefferens]|nr:ATPase [Aureococcus anophagefferens]